MPKPGNPPRARKATKRRAKAHTPADKLDRVFARDVVLGMLQRPDGATVAQIMERTGWKPHTVRAFISTQPKKEGLVVATEATDAGRLYRAAPDAARRAVEAAQP
jgi:hypothetical protein